LGGRAALRQPRGAPVAANVDRSAPARALRRAALATASIGALRFFFTVYGEGRLPAWASRLDPVIDALGLAALAVFADSALRLANRAPRERRTRLYVAAALIALGLGLELVLWLVTRLGSQLGVLVGPALASVLLWALGRATLWIGLCRWLGRGFRVVVPVLATLRVIVFAATLAGPYLEPGTRARELMIETATPRLWIALGCLVLGDLAIAWIAGKASQA
jgi:hypothetical protein